MPKTKSPIHWIAGGSLYSRHYTENFGKLQESMDELGLDAIDELQLDPLVDHYANKLFPWLTVLINEPRYYFFAPAVVESVVDHLRAKGAHRWQKKVREAETERKLRFVEASLCEALCLKHGPKAPVIGIEKWKLYWGKNHTRVTQESVNGTGGIQKSLGMHPTARYLGRFIDLFCNSVENRALIEMIDEAVLTPSAPNYPWSFQRTLTDIIKLHRIIFTSWLESPNEKRRQLSLELSVPERDLLYGGLFENNQDKVFFQDFLQQSYPILLERDKKENPSETLSKIAKVTSIKFKKIAHEASVTLQAVAHIRLCYRALASERYASDEVKKSVSCLKQLILPKHLDSEGTNFADGGLEFLSRAIQFARKSAFTDLAIHIYKREKSLKEARSKLYHSQGEIRVKKGEKIESTRDPLEYREPSLRIANVQKVLNRLSSKLKLIT